MLETRRTQETRPQCSLVHHDIEEGICCPVRQSMRFRCSVVSTDDSRAYKTSNEQYSSSSSSTRSWKVKEWLAFTLLMLVSSLSTFVDADLETPRVALSKQKSIRASSGTRTRSSTRTTLSSGQNQHQLRSIKPQPCTSYLFLTNLFV